MDETHTGRPAPVDPDATGAGTPPPPADPGQPSREAHERRAALDRGSSLLHARGTLCAPDLPDLQSDLLYTLVAENVRDYAIFLMDASGIIRCWGESARLMKWWTPQQAEGSHLRMLYPDGGAEDGDAEQHLRMAADTGEYNGEGHRVRSDGSTFWAYVTLTALRNPEGRLVGFTKVTRDFSARRAVESALERRAADGHNVVAEARRIKRAVATLSHELRNPLNAILGSLALLERRVAGSETDRTHLDLLQRNSRHLLSIVDDVLEMARTDSGEMELRLGERRLGPAIEEALAGVKTVADARGLDLTNAVSGAAADLPYWGDEGRVRQILINLLTNAIKFTGKGGRITISGGTGESVTGATLAGDGPWIYVRVEDTGRGIPPEHLETVFEPFQQSDYADHRQGTGLGLSISRQLARLMDGDLVAESEPGIGSRFTLWLPISASAPVPR